MKKKLLFALLVLLLAAHAQMASAQKIMMQGWYWDYPKTANGKWWCDTIAQKAKAFSKAGFNFIWLPPMSLTTTGSSSNGYDTYDLFNIGLNNQSTGFGTAARIAKTIDSLNKYGICPVADMVYNQRNGGLPENNGAVQGWITNYNLTKHNNGDDCFPSDRFRCILPIGGSMPFDSGTYYFKVSSASGSTDYIGKQYRFYASTKRKGYTGQADDTVVANDGGGDCSQGDNRISLGRGIIATVKSQASCGTDEFALTISSKDYLAAGDTIYLTMSNFNGNYSDHRIYGIWYSGTNSNIVDSLKYQTYTDFTRVPSHRGQMNFRCFHPNGNATCLCGDWDYPLFFNDYDQSVTTTLDTLEEWTRWMLHDIGAGGLRMDAVKNYPPTFTGQLLQYLHYKNLNPKMVVGESYDFDAGTLKSRIQSIYNNMDQATADSITVSVFDFSMQLAMKNACDAFGFDERNVFTSGMVDNQGMNGRNSVTFVNNHDFRQASQSVNHDPILAYAYLITNPTIGTPCIYYSDYYNKTHPDYTDRLNKLINCYYKYLQGSTEKEYLNGFNTGYSGNFTSGATNSSLIYQISSAQGGCLTNKDAVIAINFSGSTLKVTQHLHTGNQFDVRVGDTLVDVLGYSSQPYAVVDANSQIYIEIPARGYSVWAQEGKIHTPVISVPGNLEICGGQAASLSAGTSYPCYDYQWQRNGVNIPYANDTKLSAFQTGDYRLAASYNGTLAKYSNIIHVQVHPDAPTIIFDSLKLKSSSSDSYQWYYGKDSLHIAPISGATTQNYAPTVYGYYQVQITEGGCTNSSSFFYVNVTATNDLSINDRLTIYPNPASDMLYINGQTGSGNYKSIELLNLVGSVVRSNQFISPQSSFNTSFNIKELPAGIYLVRIQSDSGLVVKKIVKE